MPSLLFAEVNQMWVNNYAPGVMSYKVWFSIIVVFSELLNSLNSLKAAIIKS